METLLYRGCILALALGRCSLAEAEGDPRYPQHRAQLRTAARQVWSAWQELPGEPADCPVPWASIRHLVALAARVLVEVP